MFYSKPTIRQELKEAFYGFLIIFGIALILAILSIIFDPILNYYFY